MNQVGFDLKAYLAEKQTLVLEAISGTFSGLNRGSRLVQAMEYSVLAGGKRVRPVLCMAAAEAVGTPAHNVLTVAVALELIHTFSLVHDDLPAMDDDDLRRGKPTCHKAFDEATAILAGDALLNHAFYILADKNMADTDLVLRRMRVIHRLSRATGCLGMTEGQMRDMEAENKKLPLEAMEELHRHKTGALIEAAVFCGAVEAGGSPGQVKQLTEYAGHVGLAFQVADDILNVEGDPKLLGKAVGTDAERNKSTYPALMGLEGARKFARDLRDKALLALEMFDESARPLRALAEYVVDRKS